MSLPAAISGYMKSPAQNKIKMVIGVTGNFGSGKTTVANILRACAATVIDADRISRRFLAYGTPTYRRIIRIFGRKILKKDRTIDRAKLAALVFRNKKMLDKLNRLIHPQVIRMIKGKIRSAKSSMIVLDAPLLIEAGLKEMVDKLIVVKISRKEQIRRLRAKTGLGKKEILQRIKAQLAQSKKARLADFIIDNNATIAQTKKQVEEIRRSLWKS